MSYCQMLKQRQAEAEKSIIVHFTLGTKITDILNTVEKMGGTVKETFFYKVKNMVHVLLCYILSLLKTLEQSSLMVCWFSFILWAPIKIVQIIALGLFLGSL